MSYVTVENQRLNYIDKNQKELRADCYKSVKEATDERMREAARADNLFTDEEFLTISEELMSRVRNRPADVRAEDLLILHFNDSFILSN